MQFLKLFQNWQEVEVFCYRKCPQFSEDASPTEGILKGIFVYAYNFESYMAGCGSSSLDVALNLVDDHHSPPCQIEGEKMKKTQVQNYSIL